MDDARRDRGGVGRGTGEGGGYVTEGQRRVSGNAARLGSFHRSTESTARKIREEGWKNAVYSRGVRVKLLAAARAHSAHRWLRSNSPTRRIGSHRRRQRQRGRDPFLFGEVNGRTREKRRRMEGGRRKKKKGEERERERVDVEWVVQLPYGFALRSSTCSLVIRLFRSKPRLSRAKPGAGSVLVTIPLTSLAKHLAHLRRRHRRPSRRLATYLLARSLARSASLAGPIRFTIATSLSLSPLKSTPPAPPPHTFPL